MHQSTLYAVLAALTAVHAIPMTEEFRVVRRECLIVGGCGPTESLETPGPMIARRWFEPGPSTEEPGFVGPKKTRSEPLEVDGTTNIILPTAENEKRMCAEDGCDLPIEPIETPIHFREPITALNGKRMCAEDGCDLPIEPIETPIISEPITALNGKRIACPLEARGTSSSIENECGELPIEPIATPIISEPITALNEKRIAACRLALDGTTEGECGLPYEPIETPISEEPIVAKTKSKADKRIVCPLNADGTASECSEPVITPISVSNKKSSKKSHKAASHVVIRPIPLAAQTAAPVKVRGEPLEVAGGEVPLQTQPQTKPGHANNDLSYQPPTLKTVKGKNGRRSSTLESITSHTTGDGKTVVKVAGAVKNPTLTTRIIAATTAASTATVAVKGLAPVAVATGTA